MATTGVNKMAAMVFMSAEPNLKVLITDWLLVLEVWDGKPTSRKSWAVNLKVWTDLTLGPLFKVKRG